jgi:hypothetical protein
LPAVLMVCLQVGGAKYLGEYVSILIKLFRHVKSHALLAWLFL